MHCWSCRCCRPRWPAGPTPTEPTFLRRGRIQTGEVEQPTASPDITFHLTPQSADYWREWTSQLGVLVCGRTLFDYTDGWGGRHTMGVPVVVVTHQVPTEWVEAHPDAEFDFVTDGVAAAIEKSAEHRG